MKLFILFAVCAYALANTAIPCPYGYFDGGDGSCYGVVFEKINRWDAKSRCRMNGGDLAEITDGFLNSKILSYTKSLLWFGVYCLGYNNCYTESGVKSSFNNIYSNDNGVFPLIGNGYYWQTTSNPLFLADGYVCKITPQNDRCPINFYNSLDQCYSVVSNPITWAQSSQFCSFMDAQLARIDHEINNKFVVGLLQNKGFDDGFASIGLTVDPTSSVYKWSNDTPASYVNLAQEAPYLGSCVALNINSSLVVVGEWITNACDHTNQATVCSKAATALPVPKPSFSGAFPDVCREVYYTSFVKNMEITSPLFNNYLNITTYPSNTCTTVVTFGSKKSFSVQLSQFSLPGNNSYVELSSSLTDTEAEKITLSGTSITGGASPNKIYNFTSNTLIINFYSPAGSYIWKAKVF